MEGHTKMWVDMCPKQRAKHEAVEAKNRELPRPSLVMRLEMADERERAAGRQRSRLETRMGG
jgi:hypothetical protein